jgi:hypothetical protein
MDSMATPIRGISSSPTSKGKITYAPSDLRVTAGDDVAFVSCLVHCDGTSAGQLDFRLTVGFEKRAGEWIVVHEIIQCGRSSNVSIHDEWVPCVECCGPVEKVGAQRAQQLAAPLD